MFYQEVNDRLLSNRKSEPTLDANKYINNYNLYSFKI